MIYRIVLFCTVVIFSVSYSETFEEILDRALKESPQLKSYRFETQTVEGEIKSAQAFPNPELFVQFGRLYTQTEENGLNITEFSINQPLKLWGTRKKAIEKALLKKSAFESLFDLKKREFTGELYSAFYSTLYLKEVLHIKEKEFKITKGIYEFVKKSYELGEDTKLNLFRAEKDLKIAQIELEQAKTEYTISLQKLSALAGFEIKDTKGSLTEIKQIKEIPLEELPEIRYIQKTIQSLDKEIQLQKALAKPQIGIEFSASEDEVDLGKYEFGIGITASVPVFYRNQGEIISILYEKKRYLSLIKQKEMVYSVKIKSLKEKYSLLTKQIEELDRKVIPSVSQALDLGKKSFKLREITLFELSDIRKQYIQALTYKASLLNELHQIYGEYIKIGGLR
ncbi:Outer membrane protein TolC [Persephonella hydrogeniphila]|uniref:Outer membrane protein TolC n=1 Tax=Persephonella hydrogeniphila TaxID=198703 RepID=A0A285NAD8_9AQUI|nr:TolC family protein [Persephonella hydrogeniphila]SNZ06435.1 Outer membrane protein TolC [Persephonella hydrogeniphila]